MLRINTSFLEEKSFTKFTNDITIDDIKKRNILYPDQPYVNWQKIWNANYLADNVESREPINISVVGRGASGLAMLYELTKIADKLPDQVFNVTHFDFEPEVDYNNDSDFRKENKYGRIFTVNSDGSRDRGQGQSQEIGCMRFPNIAVNTWHFISEVFSNSGSTPLEAFPNPGKVLTQFIYKEIDFLFKGDVCHTPGQQDNFVMANKVKNGVILYLLSVLDLGEDVTIPSADGNNKVPANTGNFASLLIGEAAAGGEAPKSPFQTLSAQQQEDVWSVWRQYVDTYDVPLIDNVGKAIRYLYTGDDVPDAIKQFVLLDAEKKGRNEQYFIELFGRYGFGTGGFRPLNNVSCSELARLLIWNYSDEYLFPVNNGAFDNGNQRFAKGLLQKVKDASASTDNKFRYRAIEAEVFLAGKAVDGEKMVLFYGHVKSGQVDRIRIETTDYAFFGMGNHAAQKIFEPFASKPGGSLNAKGFTFRANGKLILQPHDSLLKDPLSETLTPSYITALRNLHMMRSTKYFTSFDKTEMRKKMPSIAGEYVGVVISDTDLAATYVLDNKDYAKYNILASYTWGDEATNAAIQLQGLTAAAGVRNNESLAAGYAQAANRWARAGNENFWLSTMLSEVAQSPNATGFMYDWSRDRGVRGGFKLDWAGDSPLSEALYEHYKIELPSGERQRAFLAGCSMSHLGGWLEGAFITSLNAMAGFVSNEFGKNALSDEGKKMLAKVPENDLMA